jgi:hypothetical protein
VIFRSKADYFSHEAWFMLRAARDSYVISTRTLLQNSDSRQPEGITVPYVGEWSEQLKELLADLVQMHSVQLSRLSTDLRSTTHVIWCWSALMDSILLFAIVMVAFATPSYLQYCLWFCKFVLCLGHMFSFKFGLKIKLSSVNCGCKLWRCIVD